MEAKQKIYTYDQYDRMVSFLKFARPVNFSCQSGVMGDDKQPVIVLSYHPTTEQHDENTVK